MRARGSAGCPTTRRSPPGTKPSRRAGNDLLMRPVLNLGEIVAAHARLLPDKIGARDARRAMTFKEWNVRACKLGSALLGLGLKKGDRVALLAYNRVEWMELYIGLAKAGLVAVPINFRLVAPEIQYIAQHSDAKAMI